MTRPARFAFWLGHGLMFTGEAAQANGWFGRARSLLSEHGVDCVEWGYLLIPRAFERIDAGNAAAACGTCAEAQQIARRFADPNLHAMAGHGRGRTLMGRVRRRSIARRFLTRSGPGRRAFGAAVALPLREADEAGLRSCCGSRPLCATLVESVDATRGTQGSHWAGSTGVGVRLIIVIRERQDSMGSVRTRVYRGGHLDARDVPLGQISDILEVPDSMVWVDFQEPSPDQLDALADELGLHYLAVEDALEPHQRPKVDHYDTHLFLTCHAIALQVESPQLVHTEIDAFIHPRWLVTVRKNGDVFPIDEALALWDRSPALARFGVGYLLYGILDVVIDDYFGVIEAFDAYYDEVSERLFSGQPLAAAQERQWFQMRQMLVRFHRLVIPLREVVSTLLRSDDEQISDGLRPYYQDLYDHILRISESTEALRDLVATIVETNLSLRNYRQNQIMKKVSSWAAIVAVPTLITGYYGMNVPYPGSGTGGGVVVSTFLIAAISGVLYVVFKRWDWL